MSSFRFRKKTEYGIMMMAMLAANDDKTISVGYMQERGLPRSFMVVIAKSLIDNKLVVAKEGRGGGYRLAKQAKDITLLDIVEAIEGKVATVACLVHGAERCPLADLCPHKTMMSRLGDEINDLLLKYDLAEFAGKTN